MSIWKRKPLALLLAEASDSEKGLKRTLTAWSLSSPRNWSYYRCWTFC
jgi:hypothetical protein